jgi:hypothetical protein
MALETPFKLEKLKIQAYSSAARMGDPIDTFEAMFNPASFQQKYEIAYNKTQSINSTGDALNYSYSRPAELNLKLILDGTGVTPLGVSLLGKPPSVAAQVSKFLDLTFHMNGDTHEPSYLRVSWGDLKFWGDTSFDCRLGSLNVTYTSFNRDGSALRAELDLMLKLDQEVKKRLQKEQKKSPDVTHSRVVKSGDTLPLLCKAIYGKSLYYLRVAQVNNLDDFRNLTPGQTLIFPPVASQ